jgi:hypothetical protein
MTGLHHGGDGDLGNHRRDDDVAVSSVNRIQNRRSLIRAIRLRVHSSRMRGDHFGLKNSWAGSC